MADIDMIPRSYREGLRVRRTLTVYGAALALLLVAGGGASAVLRWRVAVETPRLEQQRAASSQAAALGARLASALQRKEALDGEVAALAALRGAGEVQALATVLDGALNDKVWFDQLRFARSQDLLPAAPGTPTPGVVQARAPQTGVAQAWRLGSHVEIDGQALDNGAMSAFLGALAASPALGEVRFLNSSTVSVEEGGAVRFGAAAVLVKKTSSKGEAP